MQPRQPLGERPRILITRLSAIGDCVQTLPVATALREHFPRAMIAWAVESAAAPLVAANRAVDRVVVVPKRMLASPAAMWRVRRDLAPLAIEIAIDPQGLSKSSAIGWLSGARRRIGFASPQGREISPWLNNQQVQPRAAHMVDRYLELLAPLGIKPAAPRFGIEIDPQAERAIAPFVARRELADGFAVINPGAGWDSKRWPLARFAAVAQWLGQQHGLVSVVVWGGERERAAACDVVAGAAGHAMLAPPTSLLELAALVQQARLMVASDTGPLHLAAAIGTPCVGIFGSTRREACGPYGAGNIAVQEAFDGASGRKLPGADNWAMRRVRVEIVTEACAGILRPAASRMPAVVAG
ncbi:MAG: glycosyltransferase family 9 protein [Planctomycetaceae bacterium]|nr:glycosyltransferase family 9 protein [Planctomycetaceae bacterium]